MSEVWHIFFTWSITTLAGLPLMLLFGWATGAVLVAQPLMIFTRPGEVPPHPLIEVNGRMVRYTGGTDHPLPRRFAWFSGIFWIVFWPCFSFFMSLDHHGLGFVTRLGISLGFQALVMLGMYRLLRRLQPRWLRAHLASLPATL